MVVAALVAYGFEPGAAVVTDDEFDVFEFAHVPSRRRGEEGQAPAGCSHAALIEGVDLIGGPKDFLPGGTLGGGTGVGGRNALVLRVPGNKYVVISGGKIKPETVPSKTPPESPWG